jgi:hypothetical protein
VGSKVLFNGHDIYDFVEIQKDILKRAYESLPDEKALDEAFTQNMKKQYILDIPRLRLENWSSEQKDTSKHSTEIVVYVPFDGDPAVFGIKPSAFNGTVAVGEIVGHELLIALMPPTPDFDVAGFVQREIGKVEWHLNSLRGSMEHMNQQLESTIRGCIASRKRRVDNRAKIGKNLGIPPRQTPQSFAPDKEAEVIHPPKLAIQIELPQNKWDIFMSHASPDKPYVRGLVKELREKNIAVWFDEDSLSWGESLRQGIKKGLNNSRYGIVVLSKAYLSERKWTEHEFDALFAREKIGSFIILPIWHGIVRDEIEKYDAALADRMAKVSNTDSYPDIVNSVLKTLGRTQSEPDMSALLRPIVASGREGPNGSELAHAVYEQKGPDAVPVSQQPKKLEPTTVRILSTGLLANDNLNPKEVELLWNAAKSSDGEIYHSSTLDGESIHANEQDFLEEADPRTASEWLSALRSVENRGFIKPLSNERDFFKLTGEGYAAADQLEEFARWKATSITLRAYYMNADPQELKLSCKGIVALPATYYPDDIGADLSVQRSLKESRSLLVEGLGSMPSIDWQPTDVEFMNDATGKVETFRVDGMQYIRPSKLKLPIISS